MIDDGVRIVLLVCASVLKAKIVIKTKAVV